MAAPLRADCASRCGAKAMTLVVRGKLVALEPPVDRLNGGGRVYAGAKFDAADGRHISVRRFRAYGNVDGTLNIGSEGVFAFSREFGTTELMAVRADGQERVAPSERLSLTAVYSVFAAWSILLLLSGVGIIFMLITAPLAACQPLATARLKRRLGREGFRVSEKCILWSGKKNLRAPP